MDRGFNEAIDKGVWMAAIYRPGPVDGWDDMQPATTEEQAKEALPAGWALVGPEDRSGGCWLVIPSSRVRGRLDEGHEYRWTNKKTGWAIEISQP